MRASSLSISIAREAAMPGSRYREMLSLQRERLERSEVACQGQMYKLRVAEALLEIAAERFDEEAATCSSC
jgi:hypothetical protein